MSFQNKISEHRREFYQIYHKDIRPLLEGFKIKRKLYISKIYLYEIITALILVTVILFVRFNYAHYSVGIILVIIACLSAFILIPVHYNRIFTKEIKDYCMTPVLKIFGSIRWKRDAIPNSELNESELFATFNRRTNDDGFEGEYKGVKFEITETNLTYQSHSGKNRTCRQIFKGVIVKFASNKTIKNKTIVTTKGDLNIKRTGALTAFLSSCPLAFNFITTGSLEIFFIIAVLLTSALICFIASFFNKNIEKLKPIKLEDPVFSKKFNAYSSDEIEGRYLITTGFMERFINLNTAFGAKRAKCSFYGDNIMFAISTNRNLFEIGNLFTNTDDPKQMNKFFDEFESILLLVDYFKLYQRIGL